MIRPVSGRHRPHARASSRAPRWQSQGERTRSTRAGGGAREARQRPRRSCAGISKASRKDLAILSAAQIAEALAVTNYTNIIKTAPFFKNLASDDQGYLKAAVGEEMSYCAQRPSGGSALRQ
jgi:hypothetical protein